jgi:cell division protein FtsI (penicillin-binding protein 3)
LAIKHSSNIAMAKFSLRIPFDIHYETLRDFGIGTATGIGFGGEGPGLLRRPAANPNSLLTQPSWAQGYEFNASAVQLATAYGAIANAGVLLAPSLVHEVRDGATGAVVWRHQAEPVRQVVSPAIVDQLLAYLRLATDSGGSGGRARLDRLPVIGKTGTAVLRNAEGNYQGAGHRASFAGIFPGDDPQVVIYVMIARPRGGEIYGGAIAAPMVRSILQQILATPSSPLDRDDLLERVSLPVVAERVEPIPPPKLVRLPLAADQNGAARSIAIPELVGQSSRAAIFRLHQLGLTVRLSGAGTIRGSEPAAGTSVTPGTSVTLFAGSEQ